MQRSVVIAGFGGQGVILAGKILAQAAMDSGLEVTWLPSYGPEMRGGTANCTVVLSDEPVGSPIVDEPSALIALNGPSLDKFEPALAAGAVVVVNRSLVDRKVARSDLSAVYLPLNDLASAAGNPRTINMVALGVYLKASGALPLDVARRAMSRMLEETGKQKLVDTNARALEEGYDAV